MLSLITLCLGSIGMECVISEPCYNETILLRSKTIQKRCSHIMKMKVSIIIASLHPMKNKSNLNILNLWHQHPIARITWCMFVRFDFLRPINNHSVMKERTFQGWTSSKLGLMFLLKDTTQWRRWDSNLRPLCLKKSTLPLSHCAPYLMHVYQQFLLLLSMCID